MRLSEERINAIAERIVAQWQKSGSVKVAPREKKRLANRVAKVILDDLAIEDSLDREVRRRLRRMPSAPPEDSSAWEALFRREKEALAARRGYVL